MGGSDNIICKAWARATAFHRDESGVAMVEFAIILPMLLLMFAVILEGGRMMWAYQATAAGVRDAARHLARISPETVCVDGGNVNGSSAELLVMISKKSDGSGLFPPSVTIDSVQTGLRCVAGNFRVSPSAIVSVEADVTITFPFAGIFTLVGGSRPTFTATLEDEHRAFGI